MAANKHIYRKEEKKMPWARFKPYLDNHPDAMTTTPRNLNTKFSKTYVIISRINFQIAPKLCQTWLLKIIKKP